MANHEGVTAIVGGSRGTGAELAHKLLEDGYRVVVGYADKETRAKQVAGYLDSENRRIELTPPTYGEMAVTARIDVTDVDSRMAFAETVKRFAQEHDTSVSTLALLGAAGIGKTVRETFATNQEGQIFTARTFWETVGATADPIALTLFAQSFQGHTALHPDPAARALYPDDYAQVALSKWNGEIGLRLLNKDLNSRENATTHHILAVIVGDALGDSDPIMLLRRRAQQAADRIAAGETREGDKEMVEQMTVLGKRDEELQAAGFEPVTTQAYAQLMKDVIDDREILPSVVADQLTEYVPEKAVVNGRVIDLADTGSPLDWAHGGQQSKGD